jgi:hypothetical protein
MLVGAGRRLAMNSFSIPEVFISFDNASDFPMWDSIIFEG